MGLRRRDDDLGVHELLVELGALPFLVAGGHQLVALLLEPPAQAQLVLRRAEQAGLLAGVLAAIVEDQ